MWKTDNLEYSVNEQRGIACTPFFQSLKEKAELRLKGKADNIEPIICKLYSYDKNGVENVVCSTKVTPLADGTFESRYSFDPVSLGVYKNAVKFRAVLYANSNRSEIKVNEFLMEEVCEANLPVEETASICNITVNEKGEKGVFVQQSDGKKCVIPIIPKKVLFIGNSLLLGMFNTYGMCATSPKKDYAYLVQQKIMEYNKDCVFYKLAGWGFENALSMEKYEEWFSRTPNVCTQKPIRDSLTEDLDLILIQLGDNVNTDQRKLIFRQTIDIFMENLKRMCPKARIIWIYGWYNKQNTVDKIVEVCKQWGLERIDISEIRKKETESYQGQISWCPEKGKIVVEEAWITHPGDKGMEQIAKKIIEVLGIGGRTREV